MKDLVDMALLVASDIDVADYATVLLQIFESRGTHEVPSALSLPPTDWQRPYARLADGLPVPATSDAAHAYVAAKIAPVLAYAAATKSAR